jgi:uncharacterized membrane protein
LHATIDMTKPRLLHPLLAQFPLALFGMSFVFDLLSLRLGALYVEAARFDIAGGLVAAAVVAATGARDYRRLPAGPAPRIARAHATLNAVAVALFAVGLLVRWRARGAVATPPVPLVLSALGVVLFGFAAYLGGVLVVNLRRLTPS